MDRTTGVPDIKEIRRVAFASAIGCVIEWYDFFLYGVVAGLVFNKLFFPNQDPFVGILLAYATFATGWRNFIRPFRRSPRTQGHVGVDAAHHGYRDISHRTIADL